MKKTRSSLKSFPLKEKVAKLLLPRGSYGDGWYDHWGDCGGGGGGDYYDSTEANILSHGQTAVNVTVFKTIPLYGVSMFKRRRVFSYFLRPRLQVEFRISSMT